MARDIEEFLRKAAQRRAQAQQAANQARGGPPPAARAQPARQPQPNAPQRRQPDIVIGEVVEPVVIDDKVPSQADQKTNKLDSEVAHADEKIAAHLQEKFEHQLGSLRVQGDRPDATSVVLDSDRNKTAYELIKMFKDPSSLRAAIIMSEVLERPEHRW